MSHLCPVSRPALGTGLVSRSGASRRCRRIRLRGPEAAGLSPIPNRRIGFVFPDRQAPPDSCNRLSQQKLTSFCLVRKLALFGAIAPEVPSPRFPSLSKFGFVSRSGASRRCRTFCPASHVPAAPAHPGIGFVLHNRSLSPRPRPRNWVCFAQSALGSRRFFVGRASPPDVSQNWVCFDACDKSRRVEFRPAFPGRYRGLVPSKPTFVRRVLFVQPPHPRPRWQAAEGTPPQGCAESAIRNTKSAIEKLALFGTIVIGWEW
jgi:hypothetical protein